MITQKLTLGILVLGATIGSARAQTAAGTVLLSGNINYSNANTESESTIATPFPLPKAESKQQRFTFSPQVGFFLADNLALGLSLNMMSGKTTASQSQYNGNTTVTYTTESKYTGLAVGPFVRYYKMVGDKAGFYGQLTGGYQQGTDKSTVSSPGTSDYKTKISGGYASLAPGFVFFPTPKFGLELTLGNLAFSRLRSEEEMVTVGRLDKKSTASDFGANFGLQNLTIGAAFHLGK